MYRAGPRTNLTRYKLLPVFADREAAAFSAWYEMMPRSQSGDATPPRHLRRRDRAPALRPGPRLRRPLLHADPPDRPHQPQGPQQHADPRPGRPRQPLRHRRRRGRPPRRPPRARHAATTSTGWWRRPATHGLEIALDVALNASPDHPWIREHPEWFDWRPDGTIKYAENPPKKLRGHRQLPLLPRRDARHLARDARHVPALVRARREDLPRRQPAHQAVPVLGVGDRRGPVAAPRRDLPRRGLHPAEGDEAPRQGRLLAVLLLLHLAQRARTS